MASEWKRERLLYRRAAHALLVGARFLVEKVMTDHGSDISANEHNRLELAHAHLKNITSVMESEFNVRERDPDA